MNKEEFDKALKFFLMYESQRTDREILDLAIKSFSKTEIEYVVLYKKGAPITYRYTDNYSNTLYSLINQ